MLKPHSSYPSAIHNRATSSKAKHLRIFRLSLTATQVGNWGVLHVDKTAVGVITRYCTRYHSVMFGHVPLSKHYLHGEEMDALPPPCVRIRDGTICRKNPALPSCWSFPGVPTSRMRISLMSHDTMLRLRTTGSNSTR